MKRRFLRGVLPAGVFACVISLLGCTSESTHGATSDASTRNQDLWALPLDHYEVQTVDLPTIAASFLVQSCLRKGGVIWHADIESVNAEPGESWNSVSRKLFDTKLASKYGYGNSADLALGDDGLQRRLDGAEANRAIKGHDAEIDECFARAYKQLGNESDDSPWDLAHSLAVEAFEASLTTDAVVDAAGRWRKCMTGKGIPDLPQVPDQMPPDSITALTPQVDAPRPIGVIEVHPEERRVAQADAACRDSSGYTTASYDAEWDEQLKALDANADELERYDEQTQLINRKAHKVIADYAPSAK